MDKSEQEWILYVEKRNHRGESYKLDFILIRTSSGTASEFCKKLTLTTKVK